MLCSLDHLKILQASTVALSSDSMSSGINCCSVFRQYIIKRTPRCIADYSQFCNSSSATTTSLPWDSTCLEWYVDAEGATPAQLPAAECRNILAVPVPVYANSHQIYTPNAGSIYLHDIIWNSFSGKLHWKTIFFFGPWTSVGELSSTFYAEFRYVYRIFLSGRVSKIQMNLNVQNSTLHTNETGRNLPLKCRGV